MSFFCLSLNHSEIASENLTLCAYSSLLSNIFFLAIVIRVHFQKLCHRCQLIQRSYFPTCPPLPSPPRPSRPPPPHPPSSAPPASRRARRRLRRRTSQLRRTPSTPPSAPPSPLSPTQACSGCSIHTSIATTSASTTPTFRTDTITRSEIEQCC